MLQPGEMKIGDDIPKPVGISVVRGSVRFVKPVGLHSFLYFY